MQANIEGDCGDNSDEIIYCSFVKVHNVRKSTDNRCSSFNLHSVMTRVELLTTVAYKGVYFT